MTAIPPSTPGASDDCNGVDDDCDGVVDPDAPTWYRDADEDGYGDPDHPTVACEAPPGHVADGTDCDDAVGAVHPGVSETCDNGRDDDCDGVVDEDVDSDGDGVGTCSGDCDEADPAVHPGATETCDGIDEDCDGTVDGPEAAGAVAWFTDADGDGHGLDGSAVVACDAPPGAASAGGDCSDGDPAVYPGAEELCNGSDDDCDGEADEGLPAAGTFYPDADGDGHGDPAGAVVARGAPFGHVDSGDDCDDGMAAVFPGAPETCDGTDEDCDGTVDEGFDGDGDGWTTCDGDCDDGDPAVQPGADDGCGDGVDADCDGADLGCPLEGEIFLTTADVELTNEGNLEYFGAAVAMGDVNGDGFADLVVGAPRESDLDVGGGAVFVYFGPLSGTVASADADVILTAANSGDYLGNNVTTGDLDGDGIADLIVAAPSYGGGRGAVYVLYGPVSGSGSVTGADARLTPADTESAGMPIATGDADGDGRDDLLIGATSLEQGGDETGGAYLVTSPPHGSVSLSTATARLLGEENWDYAGYGVAIGDLDGDGAGEVIVSAYQMSEYANYAGAVYVLAGSVTGDVSLADADGSILGPWAQAGLGYWLDAGDVDADGRSELVMGAPNADGLGGHGGSLFLFDGAVVGDFGATDGSARYDTGWTYRVGASGCAGGDPNGDGIGDLLVGAPGNLQGAVYLFEGPVAGTLTDDDIAATIWGPEENYSKTGNAVACREDVNGDGVDDILVGGYYADSPTGASRAGGAWVVFGRAP